MFSVLIFIITSGRSTSRPICRHVTWRTGVSHPLIRHFQLSLLKKQWTTCLSWDVADGYYLYKKHFKTVVKNAELAEPQFPQSEQIETNFFGVSDIFFANRSISLIRSFSPIQDGVSKNSIPRLRRCRLIVTPYHQSGLIWMSKRSQVHRTD